MVVASVHIADVGARAMPGVVRRRPRPGATPGLRSANVALASPLRTSVLAAPQPGRVALIAFWDDDDALDAFDDTHPAAAALSGGWRGRLAPLRMHGTWPGMPADVPRDRHVDHEGPVVVLTLARTKLSRAVPFLRTSAPAEKAATVAPGFLWGTALLLPPFVATCSIWRDSRASMTYAFGKGDPAHPDAIAADRAKPFHHEEAFIRFHPSRFEGGLGGRNPLAETCLQLGT